jgi:hypothetical protein
MSRSQCVIHDLIHSKSHLVLIGPVNMNETEVGGKRRQSSVLSLCRSAYLPRPAHTHLASKQTTNGLGGAQICKKSITQVTNGD